MIFLLEGEEEVGSGSLSQFIKEHREELACDVIVVSDTGMAAPDTPTFSYGLRGLAGAEIIVKPFRGSSFRRVRRSGGQSHRRSCGNNRLLP
ncbi:MAG: hypothetical protein ACLT38_06980 [Akkermansia sp.]